MSNELYPSPVAPPAGRLHLDFLDRIRALAALYVVVHHLYLLQRGMGGRSQWPQKLGNSLLYGHLAVGVFIVVSGFCLALPVVSSQQLAGGTLTFYGKRARRILPPYFVALAGSVVGTVVVSLLLHRYGGGSLDLKRSLLFNLLLLQDLFPDSNVFNAPLWSVAVEWKIYFLFPLFLWVRRRFGRLVLIFAGLVGGVGATMAWLQWNSSWLWGHACP